MTNLAQSWKPKRFQKEAKTLKKDVKKQHVFRKDFRVALVWFFERFLKVFGSEIHATSDAKKNVREPF